MIYLLDTNTCIKYLNGRSEQIHQALATKQADEIRICSVVKAELFYGALKSVRPESNLAKQRLFLNRFISLAFDDNAAQIYGQIRTQLEQLGKPIGPNDLLIAAIALANNTTLVTHNTREFSRVVGLQLEDWEI
ncbi:MAG: type II toxin-antitoxin system VapC family toxin [Caldilineaceae bacterium]